MDKDQKEKLQSLQIGALLHDIGKLIMRADNLRVKHSKCGFDFLKNIQFKDLDKIETCIKYHHADKLKEANLNHNDIAYIVYEADNVAAGCDRRKDENLDESNSDSGIYKPLQSIFDLICEKNNPKEKTCYYLRTLKNNKEFNYPQKLENQKAISKEYLDIKQSFEENFKSLKEITPNSLLQLSGICR